MGKYDYTFLNTMLGRVLVTLIPPTTVHEMIYDLYYSWLDTFIHFVDISFVCLTIP